MSQKGEEDFDVEKGEIPLQINSCPMCEAALSKMTKDDANIHVNRCLDASLNLDSPKVKRVSKEECNRNGATQKPIKIDVAPSNLCCPSAVQSSASVASANVAQQNTCDSEREINRLLDESLEAIHVTLNNCPLCNTKIVRKKNFTKHVKTCASKRRVNPKEVLELIEVCKRSKAEAQTFGFEIPDEKEKKRKTKKGGEVKKKKQKAEAKSPEFSENLSQKPEEGKNHVLKRKKKEANPEDFELGFRSDLEKQVLLEGKVIEELLADQIVKNYVLSTTDKLILPTSWRLAALEEMSNRYSAKGFEPYSKESSYNNYKKPRLSVPTVPSSSNKKLDKENKIQTQTQEQGIFSSIFGQKANKLLSQVTQSPSQIIVPATQPVVASGCSIESDMARIVNDKSYRDLVIKTRDGDLHAHCIILKARTQMPLKNLKRTKINLREFDCSKFGSDEVLLCLQYIYTGYVKLIPSQCYEVCKIAQKMRCHKLYEELEPQLTSEQKSYFDGNDDEGELSEVPETDLEEEAASEI